MNPETPSSREKILETAEALFAARGFSGVGMREVADRFGLSKSALFHHFASKLELYAAVLERIFLEIDARLDSAADGSMGAFARVRRWVEVTVDTLAENPSHARLLLRTLFEEDILPRKEEERLDQILQSILGRVGRALHEGIETGDFRPVSIPHTLQTLIGMTVYHFASGQMGDEILGSPIYSATEVRRRKEEIFAFLEQGLAPRQA